MLFGENNEMKNNYTITLLTLLTAVIAVSVLPSLRQLDQTFYSVLQTIKVTPTPALMVIRWSRRSAGATFDMRMAGKNCMTTPKTRTSGRTWSLFRNTNPQSKN